MSNEKFGAVGGFAARHIGPSPSEMQAMLQSLGAGPDLEAFAASVVPEQIRLKSRFEVRPFAEPLSEVEALQRLRGHAMKNRVVRSFIGLGYAATITPTVILRNILENPGWYTQYTPYQPEIAQGRLEALLNYQTMIADLTALPVANASLLDEGTAAAEAMALALSVAERDGELPKKRFLVSEHCLPQTIEVVRTRAEPLGVEVVVADHATFRFEPGTFGVLLQYPARDGAVVDYSAVVSAARGANACVTVAADLLALTLLKPPGEWGADIVVGNSQRFGVPLGFGGPHAAFFATKDDFKRLLPGRLIGVSKDSKGRRGLRLALQTREQHIRREKATSNICTAQVLLAVIASMYAVYHGPEGLTRIATTVHQRARRLARSLSAGGVDVVHQHFFDSIRVQCRSSADREEVIARAVTGGMNLQRFGETSLVIALDEATTDAELEALCRLFRVPLAEADSGSAIAPAARRTTPFLTHPHFNRYHTETEFLRYVKRLESRDLSLCNSMIALGSCTMKLNATSEMIPVTWPEFGGIHPFAPSEQTEGYRAMFRELEQALCDITGFAAVSLQPNSGAQGEYAGLLAIRGYHQARGDSQRNVCLIPKSAHGTNPASAAMAGMQVVVTECDAEGNVDVEDLRRAAEAHGERLCALMVTYPSTHGVFEARIKECAEIVHRLGGQVYMDGANLNAQVGLCRPFDIGADVCHINLHKTFCIPHGGGGPGMGPIAVAKHLAPFLPGHPLVAISPERTAGPVSAAPWGSASILPISWMYMAMMGSDGMRRATQVAILNANYMAHRLQPHFPVLYRGQNGRVAHECIIDLREFKKAAGIEVEDIAKRLMDYGFHAPTVSFPVPGTMMIEPTESESKAELDRFCEAMIAIRREIDMVAKGEIDRINNPLKNAPHTALDIAADAWERPYSREVAAFPAPWVREWKFWPSVGRIDGSYGDRNLVCSCPPVEEWVR